MENFELPTGGTACKIDDTTTADTTYVGYAERGTPTASESWVVQKITDTDIVYGEGSWDDRTTLNYITND